MKFREIMEKWQYNSVFWWLQHCLHWTSGLRRVRERLFLYVCDGKFYHSHSVNISYQTSRQPKTNIPILPGEPQSNYRVSNHIEERFRRRKEQRADVYLKKTENLGFFHRARRPIGPSELSRERISPHSVFFILTGLKDQKCGNGSRKYFWTLWPWRRGDGEPEAEDQRGFNYRRQASAGCLITPALSYRLQAHASVKGVALFFQTYSETVMRRIRESIQIYTCGRRWIHTCAHLHTLDPGVLRWHSADVAMMTGSADKDTETQTRTRETERLTYPHVHAFLP